MNWFLSKLCPDFSASVPEAEKLRRPLKANSQCDKILQAFLRGEVITTRYARELSGSESPVRRINDVKAYLEREGRKVSSQYVKTANGARIKEWRLEQNNN